MSDQPKLFTRVRVGSARSRGKPIEVSVYDYGWRSTRVTRSEARKLALLLLELAETPNY